MTKKFLWTSTEVPGSIVAEARKANTTKVGIIKMKSITSRLFEGEIFPAETAVPVNAEYRSAIAKVSNAIEDLQRTLTMEQNKKLEYIMDTNAEIATMESKAYYSDGVRFGVEIMIEIYRIGERTRR